MSISWSTTPVSPLVLLVFQGLALVARADLDPARLAAAADVAVEGLRLHSTAGSRLVPT